MTYSPTFPPGSSPVSSTLAQFRTNWAYIESTAQVDHYFANANSNLDGHHQYVQMDNALANPGIAPDMNGVMFMKASGSAVNSTQPFFRNSLGIAGLSQSFAQDINGVITGAGVFNILNLAAYPVLGTPFPDFMGIFCISNSATIGDAGMAFVNWRSGNLFVQKIFSSGNIITIGGGAQIFVGTTAAMDVAINLIFQQT